MKKIWIIMALCLFSATVWAQSAKDEIKRNQDLSAGKYYAYQVPDVTLTEAPEGYEPFYISMFARHGSRYLTKQKKYDRPLAVLREAKRCGALTKEGKKALEIIESLAKEAEGRYGELTPKGAQQHRDLVARMFHRYPSVFTSGVHVDARSTYKTRAFLSMAAACVELKGLNPALDITMDASEHDAYYIKYKNPAYEEMHLSEMDEVYRLADSVYIHPSHLMKTLFNNRKYADSIDSVTLMKDLFELHGISQSSYGQKDLSFLFTLDEQYDMWQRNNFEWYYEKGASPLSDACMYKLERNLLENFVVTADSVIASGHPAATLRYGHDTNLAPLTVLMGIDNLSASTSDWQKIADIFRTYRIIPMCGNVQLIFYRKKKNPQDVIVKLLLNEREVTLPMVKTDIAPYYHWKNVKDYWLRTVNSITLPACERDSE